MSIDTDALGAFDRITGADLPGLDPDEWIELARVKDYLLTSEAQASAYRRVKAKAPGDEDPFAEPDDFDADDGPQIELRQDIWNYKTLEAHIGRWNLFKPLTEDQRATGRKKGDPLPQTGANKRKVFGLYGDRLMLLLNARAGGILPAVPVGAVGPDGDKSDSAEVAPVGATG